jgi:predicted transcriptional regulator
VWLRSLFSASKHGQETVESLYRREQATVRGVAARTITVDVIGHGMSQLDADTGDPPDDRITERVLQQDEFASDLNARGYTDVLVLRRENGRDVLTDSRLAIIQHLDQHGEDIESVSDLARRLERDKGAVSKDLRLLSELDVIAYEGDGDGEAKRPFLKHDHVVIEPVVY